MKKNFGAVILAILLLVSVSFAQQNKGQAAAGNIPTGKVAFVDSRSFGEGINEMKKQLDKLENEFKPRYQEIESLQGQLVSLEEEIKKGSDARAIQQKSEQAASLKKEFDRKREDFQADYQKRSEVVLGPLRDKVLKFLEEYANTRNIIIVFDISGVSQAGLVFLNPGTNITEDFVKEYNKKNPAQ
jgi:outer membrane protein